MPPILLILIIISFNCLKFIRSEKLRWIEAVSQPSSENPNEIIYEEWGIFWFNFFRLNFIWLIDLNNFYFHLYSDCPQVQCIKSYCAQQTDEISLEETDVLNVCRKMKDGLNEYLDFIWLLFYRIKLNYLIIGWFEGQRIRDGLKGWFPSDYTEEIVNQHVRARNIRLRHRLLMYTQSVIDEQKRSSIDFQQK